MGQAVSIAMEMEEGTHVCRRLGMLCLALFLSAACSSPNRGVWSGTFEGTIAGTVEFRINARGSSLTGRLEGKTNDGAPFSAKMKGKLHGVDFYATFEGKGQTGFLPVPFEGLMTGRLAQGEADGDWQAEVRTGWKMSGAWSVNQVQSGGAL